jgi:DNA-binding Lrp family transcriptional regulator
VKALEESGVIKGYHADLEASQIGFNFAAIIFVTLKDGDKRALSSFEEKVSEITNVIQAQRLFGNPDYLLHVVTKDLASFQKLYDDSLSALPNVQRLTSTIVMKSVVTNRLLPL